MSVKIVKNLSAWFGKTARDLPWRADPHPYRVWLSEIMLQQTRVTAMLPYFERFLLAFPEVEDLANAPEERVLKLWAGLGYYSRARNLHRGAKAICERLKAGDGFPETASEWRGIPGVGPYTAGAVSSIVYRKREPIVDGNIVRVLSRVHAIRKLDSGNRLIWDLSRRLVEERSADPRILNQALMELGALVCLPRNPKCGVCPIRGSCKGKSEPHAFPEKKPKKEWKHLSERKWIPLRRKKSVAEVWLIRNEGTGWREGLWDFPSPGARGVAGAVMRSEFRIRYVVTRHKVERHHFLFFVGSRTKLEDQNGRWFSILDLPAVPAPVRKAIAMVEKDLKTDQGQR